MYYDYLTSNKTRMSILALSIVNYINQNDNLSLSDVPPHEIKDSPSLLLPYIKINE